MQDPKVHLPTPDAMSTNRDFKVEDVHGETFSIN